MRKKCSCCQHIFRFPLPAKTQPPRHRSLSLAAQHSAASFCCSSQNLGNGGLRTAIRRLACGGKTIQRQTENGWYCEECGCLYKIRMGYLLGVGACDSDLEFVNLFFYGTTFT